MEANKFKQLLLRYLSGQAEEAERKSVDFWYHSYDRRALKINPDQKNGIKDLMWHEIRRKSGLMPRTRKLNYYKVGLAASLFIILATGYILLTHHPSKLQKDGNELTLVGVSTSIGQIKYVLLPDSSKIFLNANTSIRFKKHFNGKSREVIIDDGEAFFEVTHHVGRPFIVHAGKMSTRVLGTSFNIKAYRALKEIAILVKTGNVQVNFDGKELGRLRADEQIEVDTAKGIFNRSTANAEQYIRWQNREVVLKNASFGKLALLIKNSYGMELKAANSKISGYNFTIPLNLGSDIKIIMQQLCSIHHNKFKLKQNEIMMY